MLVTVFPCPELPRSFIVSAMIASVTSGDLAGKLSGYFGAIYLAKERIFDSLISIFSALYIT